MENDWKFTKNEAALLVKLLDEFGDRLGNDGCNDMMLPDTPENRELVMASENYCLSETGTVAITSYNGEIVANNGMILAYLAKKFAIANGIAGKG